MTERRGMSASDNAGAIRSILRADFGQHSAGRSPGAESDLAELTPEAVCVLASEELDAESSPAFAARLLQIDPDSHVVIDMSRLDFCDSSGVRTLLAAWRHFALSGGSMRLRHPPAQLVRVLDVCQVRDFFTITLRPG
jgi:anti-anti-sigma factor